MHGRAHLLVGAGLGIALSGGLSIEHVPVIGTTALSALLPDLDHARSDASKLYGLVTGVAACGAAWLVATQVGLAAATREAVGAALFDTLHTWFPSTAPMLLVLGMAAAAGVVSFMLASSAAALLQPSRYLKHRGPLHWPSVGLLLSAIAMATTQVLLGEPTLGEAFAIGWFSHLVTDMPTFRGMPLLEPFRRAAEHPHWRLVDGERLPYACTRYHLSPRWLRWRSGDRDVELPIGAATLGLALLATSAGTWLPLLVRLHRQA